ncbi:MAG: hypothetical protein AAFZ63_24415 [Bacteroidota bacterium]
MLYFAVALLLGGQQNLIVFIILVISKKSFCQNGVARVGVQTGVTQALVKVILWVSSLSR